METCKHGSGAGSRKPTAEMRQGTECRAYTVHPSPRSAEYGFFGCKHFSKANAFLHSKGIEEIDW